MVAFFVFRLQSLANKNVTDDIIMLDENLMVDKNSVASIPNSSASILKYVKQSSWVKFFSTAKIVKIAFDHVLQYSVTIILELLRYQKQSLIMLPLYILQDTQNWEHSKSSSFMSQSFRRSSSWPTGADIKKGRIL